MSVSDLTKKQMIGQIRNKMALNDETMTNEILNRVCYSLEGNSIEDVTAIWELVHDETLNKDRKHPGLDEWF